MSRSAGISGSWNFIHHPDGTWTWEHCDAVGNSVARCGKPFRHFQECVFDAHSHGYLDADSDRISQLSCLL